MLCHADEEYGVCLFTDIAVTSKGGGTRLSGGVACGNDKQAAAVEEGLQVNGNGLVHDSRQHKDDGMISLDEEIPDVLLQATVVYEMHK